MCEVGSILSDTLSVHKGWLVLLQDTGTKLFYLFVFYLLFKIDN